MKRGIAFFVALAFAIGMGSAAAARHPPVVRIAALDPVLVQGARFRARERVIVRRSERRPGRERIPARRLCARRARHARVDADVHRGRDEAWSGVWGTLLLASFIFILSTGLWLFATQELSYPVAWLVFLEPLLGLLVTPLPEMEMLR